MTMIRKKIVFVLPLLVLAALGVAASLRSAESQTAPSGALTIGIYAPSVEFGTAQARLSYAQGLAKAIEQASGVKTTAQAFASLGALRKANVDFAIVDGLCYSTNLGWKLLANAEVGGGTTRAWALFSSVGPDPQGAVAACSAMTQGSTRRRPTPASRRSGASSRSPARRSSSTRCSRTSSTRR